mgnify:FL=1
MFNISPMELMLVCVVALLVIGPDKLPGAIRTGSLWLGRFRRSYNKVKSEIERELNTDEIKRQLHNEAVLEEIEDAKARVKKIADETKVSVDSLVSSSSFDPGASSATESQTVRDLESNTIAPGMTSTKQPEADSEAQTSSEQKEAVSVNSTDTADEPAQQDAAPSSQMTPTANKPRSKPSYSTGVNPKLAGTPEDDDAQEPDVDKEKK